MSNFWDDLMGDDEHAATYMATYGEGPESDTRFLLAQFVNKFESVLDVGCGPGWNMDHFAEYGPQLKRYKGVDYSERFVRVANERRKGRSYPSTFALPFEKQDCRDLKEPNDSWDVVIVQDCLEHTNGFEKPMQEALRVARKRVLVTFWHLQENEGHINDDGNDGYGAWYQRSAWEDHLNKLGYAWEWTDMKSGDNQRQRDYYIIDKEI